MDAEVIKMRGQRTERLVRIVSRMFMGPSSHLSLTDIAAENSVSKTVISDDMEIISDALAAEGLGRVIVDRGRNGGARFAPQFSAQRRRALLDELSVKLSVPERLLPGGWFITRISCAIPTIPFCSALLSHRNLRTNRRTS
jgi:Bacterial purine repressor, N-terminal.